MPRAIRTRRVFLIGFMGAGKTSVGKVLAQRLGWTFQDLDDAIERRAGQSVAAIFASQGETGFRRIESAALRELLAEKSGAGLGMIVALGGGAFVQPENRSALDHAGAVTVLLEAPLEELRRRCARDDAGDTRPLARDAQKFAELLEQRQSDYQRAQFRVDTMGKSVEQVASEMESKLRDVMR
ncbi:MAG TPA: shikimate kinase [Candidatus Angelobacter sp.]|nr:shikimate kinase [Candidatus Angelobacter sp.]